MNAWWKTKKVYKENVEDAVRVKVSIDGLEKMEQLIPQYLVEAEMNYWKTFRGSGATGSVWVIGRRLGPEEVTKRGLTYDSRWDYVLLPDGRVLECGVHWIDVAWGDYISRCRIHSF